MPRILPVWPDPVCRDSLNLGQAVIVLLGYKLARSVGLLGEYHIIGNPEKNYNYSIFTIDKVFNIDTQSLNFVPLVLTVQN